MSYADIIAKYKTSTAQAATPTPVSGVRPVPTPTPTPTVAPRVDPLKAKITPAGKDGTQPLFLKTPTNPYEAIAVKYAKKNRASTLQAQQEQGVKDAESAMNPGIKEEVKRGLKALPGAVKTVVTEPFKRPGDTVVSVASGLLDLGPTIARSIGHLTRIDPLKKIKNPGDTEVGKIIGDAIKKRLNVNTDSDVQQAIRSATTTAGAFELGGGGVNTLARGSSTFARGTVLNRVLGNVAGGQLVNESDSLKDRAKQAAFDAAFALATEGAVKASMRVFGKKAPIVEAQKGEVAAPEPISSTTPKESTVKYVPKKDLGRDLSGEKVLATTEVDSKTGRAIVYYDKSLDAQPDLKAQVLDHEFGHVVDKRINSGSNLSSELSNYKGNKTNVDNVMAEFSAKQGRNAEDIAAALKNEIDDLGGAGSNPNERFANSVAEYLADPAAVRQRAPTFAAFMEHQAVTPRISERSTTLKTLNQTETPPTPVAEAPVVAKPAPSEAIQPQTNQAIKTKVNVATEQAQPRPLPKIEPKKVLPEDVQMNVLNLEDQVAGLRQVLDDSPLKRLAKYANKNGELPEVSGVGKGKFRRRGDSITDELGFEYTEDARAAYQEYRSQTARLKELKDQLRQAKLQKVEEYTAEQIDRINKLAAEATKSVQVIKETTSRFSGTGLKTGKTVKTASFNPSKINAPEETVQLFRDMSKGKNDFSSQRISKSNEDLKDLARLTGLTPEELIKAKPGSIANAETLTAARQLVLNKAQELSEFLKATDLSAATPAELKVLRDKVAMLVAMQKAVAGLRTEASNVFRSFKAELLPGENATLAELGMALKEANIASEGDLSIFASKVAKEINLTRAQKVGQGALSTWYSAILSGPKTTVRNILSTSANILTDLASKAGNPKLWQEIPGSVSALMRGLADGWGDAKQVLAGKNAVGKFMETGNGVRGEVFTGRFRTYGQIVESVGRFLNAQDTLLSSGARAMERESLRLASPAMSNAISEAVSKAYAESSVFHGIPKGRVIQGLRDGVQALRRKVPESKVIVPFVDTVANVVDRQFDYLPVTSALRLRDAVLRPQAERIAKEFSLPASAVDQIITRLRDQQIGRMVLGTAVASAATVLAAKGRISGSGPSSISERNQLQDSGWRPNSIKFGDVWVPYTYLGPLAGIFTMAGNIHDKTKYDKAPNKTVYDLMQKGIIGWLQTQLDQSFLSGASDLLDVVNGGVSPASYFKRFASGLVPIPAAYSQTKDLIFRQQYETQGFVDEIKKKLGITGGLQPRLNAFGQPMKSDLIYGITPSIESNDPVRTFLIDNELVVSKPSPKEDYSIPGLKKQYRRLTPEEYTRYVSQAGDEIYRQIKARLKTLDKLPLDKKKAQIQDIVESTRKRVRTKIMLEAKRK